MKRLDEFKMTPPGDYSPSEFKAGRRGLGLSQSALARLFGVQSDRTVRKWECGERDIPGPAKVLMRWLITGKRPL